MLIFVFANANFVSQVCSAKRSWAIHVTYFFKIAGFPLGFRLKGWMSLYRDRFAAPGEILRTYFFSMRNDSKKPTTQPKPIKIELTRSELTLHQQMMQLMEDDSFAFNSAGSLLSLLQMAHTNLHDDDYVQLFRLLDFLNSMQHVRGIELERKLEVMKN